VAVSAVIFDWGGTLTPWHTIDHAALWLSVCEPHYPDDAASRAERALAAELDLWRLATTEHRSSTIFEVLRRADIEPTDAFLDSYRRAWEPHTFTDPDGAGLLAGLRERGIRTGVLSNTLWPRDWHEHYFRRDGVLHLIDGAVYTSEIDRTKPHPEAFAAAMRAVGVTDPGSCVFVGDRPWDDIHGAKQAGLRAVLVPHSEVPGFDGAAPDAVISRLRELGGVIDSWR
jgi:putative hydrolase of the HAD superfamily